MAGLMDGLNKAVSKLTHLGSKAVDGAKLVLVCRKLYQAPLAAEGFVEPGLLDANYPERDLHEVYVGEITRVLVP